MNANEMHKPESIDTLPRRAYKLGTDRADRDHWHDAFSSHVWVFRDDELVHERDLPTGVVDWVLFVDEEMEGWETRQRVEDTDGFGAMVRDVSGRLEDTA